VNSLSLDFDYEVAFGAAPPEAYETLLLDVLRGDSTLFTRQDWVEVAWALLTPLLNAWHKTRADFIPIYPAGSWGPKEADAFIEKDGHHWRKL
jgi:glucose-6-phosphate 1-dehydrogenase